MNELNCTIQQITWHDTFRLIPIPVVSIIGIFTNGLNIAVFMNHRMKNSTFKYMFVISINDFIYLTLCSILSIDFCNNCSVKYTYVYSFYLLYIDDYLTSCLAIYCILIEIVISYQRYSIITNKKYKETISFKLLLFVLLIIALLFYFPMIFLKEIKKCQNGFQLIYKNKSSEIVYIVISFARIFLGVLVLSAINILNGIKFSKMYHNKLLVKNERRTTKNAISAQQQSTVNSFVNDKLKESKANRNMTLMVIFSCALNFIGMIPHNLMRVLKYFISWNSNVDYNEQQWFLHVEMMSTCVLLLSHAVTIFVYYYFNPLFHSILVGYFRRFFMFFYRKINVY